MASNSDVMTSSRSRSATSGGSLCVKAALWPLILACVCPSRTTQARLRREMSACHRHATHTIPCSKSQNLDVRHSHRLTYRSLRAIQAERVKKRSVEVRSANSPTTPPLHRSGLSHSAWSHSAVPRLRDGPSHPLAPPKNAPPPSSGRHWVPKLEGRACGLSAAERKYGDMRIRSGSGSSPHPFLLPSGEKEGMRGERAERSRDEYVTVIMARSTKRSNQAWWAPSLEPASFRAV